MNLTLKDTLKIWLIMLQDMLVLSFKETALGLNKLLIYWKKKNVGQGLLSIHQLLIRWRQILM